MENYKFSKDLIIKQEKSLQFAYEQSLQEDFVSKSNYINDETIEKITYQQKDKV